MVAFTSPRSGASLGELAERRGIPAGAELGRGRTDDDAGEAQVRVFVAPPANERIERGLARSVGHEERPRVLDRDRRQEHRPPAARVCRCGMARRHTSAAPTTFVSSTACHSSAPMSTSRPSGDMPVAYTSASSPPNAATASSTMRAAVGFHPNVGAYADHLAVALRARARRVDRRSSTDRDDAGTISGGGRRDRSAHARGGAHHEQATALDAGLEHRSPT